MDPIQADTKVVRALGNLTPQDPHFFFKEHEGMDVLQSATERFGYEALTHHRTSEYVTATATKNGEKFLLRAGHPAVEQWHFEEVLMANDWADAGGIVLPAQDFLVLPKGSVSVWPYYDHNPKDHPDFQRAGEQLAKLHTLSEGDASKFPAFHVRPWRAPGKIAARLIKLEQQQNPLTPLLPAAASLLADLTERAEKGPNSAIHGDYTPGNWLPGKDVAVVDFATSCWGPALWDLTLLAGRVGSAEVSRREWQDFCRGYDCPTNVLEGTVLMSLRRLSTLVAKASYPATEQAFVTARDNLAAVLDNPDLLQIPAPVIRSMSLEP